MGIPRFSRMFYVVQQGVSSRKEEILTGSLIIYVLAYVFFGIAGVGFHLQPAASYYYYAPFNFTAPSPTGDRIVGPQVSLEVNITDEEDGDDIIADFYINESYNGTDNIASGERATNWANGTSEGMHEWFVNASDPDGAFNTSPVWMFTVDTTEPVVTSSTHSPTVNDTQSVNYTVTEAHLLSCGATGAGVSWDCSESDPDSDNVYQGTCNPGSNMSDGNHEVNVSCTDRAGNTGFNTSNLVVDTTPPSVTCDECDFPDPVGSGNDVNFDPSVSDATTSVARIEVCEDSGGSPDCSDLYCSNTSSTSCSYTTPESTFDTRDYWVRATDETGNTAPAVGPNSFTMKKEEGESCSSDEACLLGDCVEEPETGQSFCEVTRTPEPGIILSFLD